MFVLFLCRPSRVLAAEPPTDTDLPALAIPFSVGALLPVGNSDTFFKPGIFFEAGPALHLGESLVGGFQLGYSALPLTAGPTLSALGVEIGVQYAWSALPRLAITAT